MPALPCAAVPAPAYPTGSMSSPAPQPPHSFPAAGRLPPVRLQRCATAQPVAQHRATAPQRAADAPCAPLSIHAETQSGSPPAAPLALRSPLPEGPRSAAGAVGPDATEAEPASSGASHTPASVAWCARPSHSAPQCSRVPGVPARRATAAPLRAPRPRQLPRHGHPPCAGALLPAPPELLSAPSRQRALPLLPRAPAPRDSWAVPHSALRRLRQRWRARVLRQNPPRHGPAADVADCRPGLTAARDWRPASRSVRSSKPAHHPARTLPSPSSLLPASMQLMPPCTSSAHSVSSAAASPLLRRSVTARREGGARRNRAGPLLVLANSREEAAWIASSEPELRGVPRL